MLLPSLSGFLDPSIKASADATFHRKGKSKAHASMQEPLLRQNDSERDAPLYEGLGLEFAGQLFEERFLIADVELEADLPPERWFWFQPSFHAGQSALLHKPIEIVSSQVETVAQPTPQGLPADVIKFTVKVQLAPLPGATPAVTTVAAVAGGAR